MIRLTEGIVSDSLSTLAYFNESQGNTYRDLISCCHTRSASREAILEFILGMKWIYKQNGKYKISDVALKHIENFESDESSINLWKSVIDDYIDVQKPAWVSRAIYGRAEAAVAMSADEIRCLSFADLFSSPASMSAVQWWDDLANRTRIRYSMGANETGRKGELLSIRYETCRVKQEPIWQSIDSNLSGYDILSIKDECNAEKLLIEVKSSFEDIDFAKFHISRNEWRIAEKTPPDRYVFYLWCFHSGIHIARISKERIQEHIPFDRGNGMWESVTLPFSIFRDSFEPYPG